MVNDVSDNHECSWLRDPRAEVVHSPLLAHRRSLGAVYLVSGPSQISIEFHKAQGEGCGTGLEGIVSKRGTSVMSSNACSIIPRRFCFRETDITEVGRFSRGSCLGQLIRMLRLGREGARMRILKLQIAVRGDAGGMCSDLSPDIQLSLRQSRGAWEAESQ